MNETSKMPFEPITLPGMPALPEMPKPSFSRSTNTPAPQPFPSRPSSIVDDRPMPHPSWGLTAEEFVPEIPLTPAPAPAASSGFPMNWLKPSRAKGVVLAGVASLALGAFGLNALVPIPKETAKPNGFGDSAALPSDKKATAPKITEERPTAEPPGLFPKVKIENEPAKLPGEVPIVVVGDTVPTVPVIPVTKPGDLPVPALTPAPLTVPPLTADPLPVPTPVPVVPSTALPVPALPGSALPPPALPGFEEKPLVVPGSVKVEPLVTPMVTPNLPPVVLEEPKVPMVVPGPLPMPIFPTDPKPSIELKPFKEPDPLPLPALTPTPLPTLTPTPAPPVVPVSVEAKTDYDVDIHKIRVGDTYSAISEKFYGNANFANALRSYNDNADIAKLRDVQVPPMHIIKKFGAGALPAETPRVIPVSVLQDPTPGLVAPPPIENGIQWGSAGDRKKTPPAKPGDEKVQWK